MRVRCVVGLVVSLTSALFLSGCGGKSSGASVKSSAAPSAAVGGAAQQPPGTSGLIAAASPGLLEVQSQTDQTSVTYTAKTVFSQQKDVTEAAVVAGACVTALDSSALGSARRTSTSSPSTAPSMAPSTQPSTTPGSPVTITATTVTITQPVAGSCAARNGFGAGTRPSGRPSQSPTGARTGGRGFGGFGGVVTGRVSAVSGATITVQAVLRQGNTTVRDTVDVTSATKYVETVAATSAAAKVGLCATAVGPADSTGAIAATRIDLSAAQNGSCAFAARGRPGFGAPRAGTTTGG